MAVQISLIAVLIFGIVICALSAWGIYAPDKLVKLAKNIMDSDSGIYLAVIVRVLLGIALILAAGESRFPVTFQVLGWITILAAVAIGFAGRGRLRRLTAWFGQASPRLVRVWLLVGIAFGGFLIYGAI